jgi:hypothetical protein
MITSPKHNTSNIVIIKVPIEHFVCFDLEWDTDGKITAASFIASDGFKEVDLVEEYSNHQIPERALLVQIVNVLSRYEYSFGWYSRGYRSFNKKKNR